MMTLRDMIMLRLMAVVFVTHISSDLFSQDTDSLKCWSDTDKLRWTDFKGKAPGNGNNLYIRAQSWVRVEPILVEKNNAFSYRVKSIFQRYKSWKTDTADYLLAHEQLHFDLTELLARKLRKAIQAAPDPTGESFDPVIQKLYQECADMQAAYDKDTAHGIIAESQASWKKKVCEELKKLKEYASTPADCE
ncbi:DUF922 domain-containing protein [Chryseolinea soli]|uniref:DUF922 domain-containing protein n=1 Tax=Chryseolinea soli TaxID=2321403 RepID=A0A385SR97_9BACT|nr:hypothetical protein [Chryseolinea soli]AYB34303.1 hypothetical protein D4L85_28650 [Chryseolinea soli]